MHRKAFIRLLTVCIAGLTAVGASSSLFHEEAAAAPIPAYADKSDSYTPVPRVELTVRSSGHASFRTEMRLESPHWIKAIRQAKPLTSVPADYSLADVEVAVADQKETSVLLLRKDGVLVDPAAGKAWMPDHKFKQELLRTAQGLRESHYGRAVPWIEAEKLVPRKAVFTIADLETGLRFRGQRRAGSSHADVQPLTKEDTAVMKQVYGGRWSWHRRAVLVLTDKGAIAGSMHGMPHGGDGIPGNDFKGHFCIHFAGSVTHGSGNSDPVHQIMVQKAAGRLAEHLQTLTPFQIADLFVAAANQKDPQLMSVLVEHGDTNGLMKHWLNDGIISVRRISEPPESSANKQSLRNTADSASLSSEIHMKVSVWRQGNRPTSASVKFELNRSAPGEAWRIIQPESKERIDNREVLRND